MSQTVISISASLPFVLCGGFLIAILCGVFEKRARGDYRFRSKRFLAVIAIVVVLNVSAALAVIPLIKSWMLDAAHTAEVTVMKNRAVSDYTFENLGVMFPEIAKDKNEQCYRAALSNYMEDDWNKSFNTAMWRQKEPFCKENPLICNGKQDDYFEAIRNKVNPFHLLFRDFTVIGYFLGTDWMTAAESYKKLHQITRQPDNHGNMPPPPDGQMLADYRKYWANCSSLKPLSWAVPDGPLLRSEASFCIGRCQ